MSFVSKELLKERERGRERERERERVWRRDIYNLTFSSGPTLELRPCIISFLL